MEKEIDMAAYIATVNEGTLVRFHLIEGWDEMSVDTRDSYIAGLYVAARHPFNEGVEYVITEDVFYGTRADMKVQPLYVIAVDPARVS